jgi:hypothetical protein
MAETFKWKVREPFGKAPPLKLGSFTFLKTSGAAASFGTLAKRQTDLSDRRISSEMNVFPQRVLWLSSWSSFQLRLTTYCSISIWIFVCVTGTWLQEYFLTTEFAPVKVSIILCYNSIYNASIIIQYTV